MLLQRGGVFMTFIQADANNPVSMGTITCKNSDVSSIGMQLAKATFLQPGQSVYMLGWMHASSTMIFSCCCWIKRLLLSIMLCKSAINDSSGWCIYWYDYHLPFQVFHKQLVVIVSSECLSQENTSLQSLILLSLCSKILSQHCHLRSHIKASSMMHPMQWSSKNSTLLHASPINCLVSWGRY